MDRRPASPEEARALANPLRLRILRLCLDRELTNEELATRLGKDAGSVLHHVRLLVKTGFLAPGEERRGARGSVERPYRATRKSWTLDVSDEEAAHSGAPDRGSLALVDAFRAELGEVAADAIVSTVRLGVRLTPGQAKDFADRFQVLVNELVAADDPAGEPHGFFLGMHRAAD